MTSREKFEAWFLSEHEAVENSNELSAKLMKMMAWQSWQAAEIAADKKLTDMAVQLANAESKCRELAAENAAVKECASDVMRHVYRSKTYLDSNRVVDAIQGLQCAIERKAGKTPATDAFLAEVRASGADEVSAICRALADKDGCSVNMRCSYNLTAERAEAVAAQLRKGAAQ